MTTPQLAPSRGLTGYHVLAMVVTFFLVIIGADVFFSVLAYRTFSGEVASNPYEAGLAFNRTLAQRRRETALGWSAQVATPRPGVVALRVKDRAGAPLSRLSLTGVLERPATETGRQVLTFEPAGDGWYTARAELAGAWDLRAEARDGENLLEIETRLVAP